MKIGIVGLGRMGGNIARRLMRHGHNVVVFDQDPNVVKSLSNEGAQGASSLEALHQALSRPQTIFAQIGTKTPERAIIWLMLPAGPITESTIEALRPLMNPGDVLIDGGNTHFKDDVRRAKTLKSHGIDYVDVGTSGGVWGLERGYCLMIGGEAAVVSALDPIFSALSPGSSGIAPSKNRTSKDDRPARGYIHAGPVGAGHYVKMIHNGIEYGMMQAYAEGFELLSSRNSQRVPEDECYDINVSDVAETWRRGSVVTSWLLDLTNDALAKDQSLGDFSSHVSDSGEGQWTIEAAMEQAVPVPVLSSALFARYRSRQGGTFAEKILSAMRFGFGGHTEKK
jgi:6-phosphogluconate dehydrogenase